MWRSQMLLQIWPQESSLLVPLEPVDIEDLGQIVTKESLEVNPATEVIAHIITARKEA